MKNPDNSQTPLNIYEKIKLSAEVGAILFGIISIGLVTSPHWAINLLNSDFVVNAYSQINTISAQTGHLIAETVENVATAVNHGEGFHLALFANLGTAACTITNLAAGELNRAQVRSL